MYGEMVIEWKMVLYPLIAILSLWLIRYMEERFNRRKPLSDEEYLAKIAKMRECSEYDLFRICGEDWRYSKAQIEKDFKEYLIRGSVPYYIRDFIRKNKKEVDENYRSPFNGGRLPPSWFA
jgi:predicted AAA+ superfamily ATPase